MKKFSFYTLGCKVNQYETQAMREAFIRAGYIEANPLDRADLYIINTCTVTAKADKECRRLIRKVNRCNPAAKVIVTGCYAESDEDVLGRMQGVYKVIKNNAKDSIVDIIESRKDMTDSKVIGYTPLSVSGFKDHSKAFVKIQDGCDNFCSYCKIPFVRGKPRSRDIDSTLKEVRQLVSSGYKEIVLSGICLGVWGKELRGPRELPDIIEKIVDIDGDFRLRLSSIEPANLNERLIDLVQSEHKLCKHFHIPLQSGDDRILSAMNRPYTSKGYLGLIDLVRDKIEGVSITTDVLVGFPGESDSCFQNTCDLLEAIQPLRIHIFPYSRRPGTMAAEMGPDIPRGIIKDRARRLQALAVEKSHEFRKTFLGKTTNVLVENERNLSDGLFQGYDDRYIKIVIKSDAGRCRGIVSVRVDGVDSDHTWGTII
ncbi:MAG: tRNA (N(6)-L-threonylcarbamoyladenosine(37)-C(2))-methylthiotransferase MtaB [Candidatus Omnitrophica bacterium]|nr:tRNA (N(6)-L-threonylcarbamoyladenosine(37)-C(2))-methylthiotransferase MtaB [Candidatus Omnitrophota bacterium]